MKSKKWLIGFLVFAAVYATLAFFPRPQSIEGINPLLIENGSRPLLIAHGGGNREFPDNTLEAFYHAYSIDPLVMMETDVSITKDGVVILSHDVTLDRKTNLLDAPIIDINYSDLIADEVDFGYANNVEGGVNVSETLIPYTNYLNETVTPTMVTYPEGIIARHATKFLATTLEELITSFPDNYINVEIKQSGETGLASLAAVLELMEALDAEYHTFERIVLASFHDEIYAELQRIQEEDHPELMYSPESGSVTKLFVLHLLALDVFYTDKVAVLQLPMEQYGLNLSTKALIRSAHRHNIAVHYWTIDDEDDMRLLIDNGADGIMTNIPSRLKAVYDSYDFTN